MKKIIVSGSPIYHHIRKAENPHPRYVETKNFTKKRKHLIKIVAKFLPPD